MNYKLYRECLEEADKRMKEKNGHMYVHILKTRCDHCGRSEKAGAKFKCRGWFDTYVNILGIVFQERGIIQNNN